LRFERIGIGQRTRGREKKWKTGIRNKKTQRGSARAQTQSASRRRYVHVGRDTHISRWWVVGAGL
jgi:lysozyme family protein